MPIRSLNPSRVLEILKEFPTYAIFTIGPGHESGSVVAQFFGGNAAMLGPDLLDIYPMIKPLQELAGSLAGKEGYIVLCAPRMDAEWNLPPDRVVLFLPEHFNAKDAASQLTEGSDLIWLGQFKLTDEGAEITG